VVEKGVKDVKTCRICRSRRLYRFLDLGSMPIPNGFLKKEELLILEKKYELACFFCENCGLVQLTKVVSPHLMFGNYVYIPSTAKVMMNNFSNLAYQAYKELKLKESSLVVDIGSNDGSLLAFFKNYGTKVLGVDPAKNLAKIAQMRGIPTEDKLFNLRTAKHIKEKYGKADLITATNVVAHIDYLHKLFEAISFLLTRNGVLITEFPYLLDLVKKDEFDTIYHEHLSYFSLRPWIRLVELFGFEVVDAQRLLIHGGSIRLTHKRKKPGVNIRRKTVDYLISLEEHYGLYDKKTFVRLSERVEELKNDLTSILKDLKRKKKKIIGYGAAAKGNVLTNYFGIGTKILNYIVDSTPYKQGLFTPGMHIPVFGEGKLVEDRPDYALILAWNFADEIIEKQKAFRRRGGKFIIPIPKVRIV